MNRKINVVIYAKLFVVGCVWSVVFNKRQLFVLMSKILFVRCINANANGVYVYIERERGCMLVWVYKWSARTLIIILPVDLVITVQEVVQQLLLLFLVLVHLQNALLLCNFLFQKFNLGGRLWFLRLWRLVL